MPYSERTKEELETELFLREKLEKEREENDKRYAIKLVEKILFGLVSLIVVSVIAAVLNLVLK